MTVKLTSSCQFLVKDVRSDPHSYIVSCWVIKLTTSTAADLTCRNGTLATTLHVGVGWS